MPQNSIKLSKNIKIFNVLGTLSVFIFLFTLNSLAAPDQELTYHGKLTSVEGIAVPNDNYIFELSIYDVSTGGTALWTDTQTVSVQSGVFSTNLTNLDTLDFSQNYYLGVSINGNSEMTPRRKITPTGFALNSHRLNGQEADFYLDTSATAQTKAGALGVDGNFTVNTNNLFVDTSTGRVGIGTNSPDSKLTIDASSDNGLDVYNINQNNQKGILVAASADDDGDNVYGFYSNVDAGSGSLTGNWRVAYGLYNNVTNNAVGVSPNSPSVYGVFNSLDVSQDSDYYKYVTGVANINSISGGYYSGDNTVQYGVSNSFALGGENSLAIGSFNRIDFEPGDGLSQEGFGTRNLVGTISSGDIFYGGNTIEVYDPWITGGTGYGEYIDLDAAGWDDVYSIYVENGSANSYFGSNIGIGTTGPSQALHISGNMRLTGAFYDSVNSAGVNGYVLQTTGVGTQWVEASSLGMVFENVAGVIRNTGTNASDDFVFGSPQLADDGNSNHDARMFFDKSKGAFRAGIATGTQWDNSNVGNYSIALGDGSIASGLNSTAFGRDTVASAPYATAFGHNTTASGSRATAFGRNTLASGDYSMAFGSATEARSGHEVVFGQYDETYTPIDTAGWNLSDRLFVVANGASSSVRSNALTILKNGNIGIGESSPTQKLHISGNMRLTGQLYDENNEAGTVGQILSTTATGTDWIDAPSGGGSSTFLNLTDTPASYSANQVFFANAAGSAVTSSSGLTFDATNLTVTGNIIPGADDTYNLGSPTQRWQDLYLGPASLHIGVSSTAEGIINYDSINDILNITTDSTANGNIAFNSNQLFIDKLTGNIGLGTDSPVEKLTLNGGTLLQKANSNPIMKGLLDPNDTNIMNGPRNIYVSGDYAYVGNGISNNMLVVSVSDPSNPSIVGNWDVNNTSIMNSVSSIYVNGDHAYVTGRDSSTVAVIDISDPSSPVMITYLSGISSPESIRVNGKYAYIISSVGRLYIIDISDPSSPSIINNWITSGSSEYALDASGKYLYITGLWSNTVEVVDISNPLNPTAISTWTAPVTMYPQNIHVSGKYAYVASGYSNDMVIVDISDPSSPVTVGVFNDSSVVGGIASVYALGDYAYISGWSTDNMAVVDVSDPANPITAGHWSPNNTNVMDNAYDVHVSGKYAHVVGGTSNTVAIIDIAGIDAPSATIGSIAASQVSVRDNANINNNLIIGNSLNVGRDALISGSFSASNTIRFSTFGAGTLTTDASGNVTVSSDERLKNIEGNFTRGLSDLLNINPISYTWKQETGYDTLNSYYGFSAQNIQESIPEAVNTDKNGYLTLSDRPLLATAINAIKEQNVTISSNTLKTDTNITSLTDLQTSIDENLLSISDQFDTTQTNINNLSNIQSDIQDRLDVLEIGLDVVTKIDEKILTIDPDKLLFTDTDTEGNTTLTLDGIMTVNTLRAQSIETNALTINDNLTQTDIDGNQINASSVGTATIVAGETEVVVETLSATQNGEIFVTAKTHTDHPLFVDSVVESELFVVKIANPLSQDVNFSWFIVETN